MTTIQLLQFNDHNSLTIAVKHLYGLISFRFLAHVSLLNTYFLNYAASTSTSTCKC